MVKIKGSFSEIPQCLVRPFVLSMILYSLMMDIFEAVMPRSLSSKTRIKF